MATEESLDDKNYDSDALFKLSDLDLVSIKPKPIERQRVFIVLKVFCDKTLAALRVHPKMQDVDTSGTEIFIEKVLQFWKIVNVHDCFLGEKKMDPLMKPISDPKDSRLQTLLDFGDMASQMAVKSGKRKRQLTKDTSMAIYNTCNG